MTVPVPLPRASRTVQELQAGAFLRWLERAHVLQQLASANHGDRAALHDAAEDLRAAFAAYAYFARLDQIPNNDLPTQY